MTVELEIVSQPIKVKIEPMPSTNENLAALSQMVSNASLAASQKFLPVKAISM